MMTDEDKLASIKNGRGLFSDRLCGHVQDENCAMARNEGWLHRRRGRAHGSRTGP